MKPRDWERLQNAPVHDNEVYVGPSWIREGKMEKKFEHLPPRKRVEEIVGPPPAMEAVSEADAEASETCAVARAGLWCIAMVMGVFALFCIGVLCGTVWLLHKLVTP